PARLWASLHGPLAAGRATGVVGATGVELAPLTGGQLDGAGGVLAALELVGDQLRGTLVAGRDLPLAANRDANEALQHVRELLVGPAADALGQARALDGAFGAPPGLAQVVYATGALRFTGGGIALEQTQVVARASEIVVGDQRVTGALASVASVSGSLTP